MTDDERRPKHPLNTKLIWDGVMFVVVLAIGVTFYVLAFHPFR